MMKNDCLFLLGNAWRRCLGICVWGCMAITANAALISGVIKNGTPESKISVVAPHYYLDGRSSTYHGVLDAQSRFSFEVELPESGVVFLEYNDDRLPLFLSQDDTLVIRTDAFQFPVLVGFGGNAAGNNRLYQEYLKQNQLDFNEFNNIRFRIGQTWITVEDAVNGLMESLTPELFRGSMDAKKSAAIDLVDAYKVKNPDALSPQFSRWLEAEITYSWAYHLLVYGQVYAFRYDVQPTYFDFLFDAPITSTEIGSDWYRKFVLAFVARQQVKTGKTDNYWSGQYYLAEDLLSGKSLAFFRSEMIATAFSLERFNEILPLYSHFLQKNPFPAYDDKIEGLYQKYARVSPGTAAPAFEATDRDGHPVNLHHFEGKVVYLNFWASWCGACLRKMTFFNDFEPELKANNIEIVNVSLDDNQQAWQNAIEEHALKGVHLLAVAGSKRNIANAYGVEAIPQYFIIGSNGMFESKAASSQPNDIREKLLEISRAKK